MDLEQLRSIFEKFTQSTGFTIGFLDHPGLNVLTATGWRDICTKFHRACPASIENCLKSNMHLLKQLREPGQIVIEECDNHLVDCATPIIIKGKHIASLATGQLLLKAPDIELFRTQAREFGYDEKKYMEALEHIPVVSGEKLKSITGFLGEIATLISEMGYTNLVLKEEAVLLDREITERKHAEEQLQLLSSAVKQSTEGIAITDLAGRLLFVNRAFAAMHGYDQEELLGKHLSVFHTPDQMPAVEAANRRLRETGEFTGEIWHARRDGTVFPTLMQNSLLRDDAGNPIGLMGTLRDISTRKKAEDEIKRNLSLLNSTIESTADGILVVSREGKWEKFNRKFIEMWRIPASIVRSENDEEALTFVLDQLKDPEAFLSKVRELYAEPEAVSHDVIEFKDGRCFERYSQPQEIEGTILARVWSFRDVTQRKQAGDALKESEAELQRRVKELQDFYDIAIGRELRMKELKEQMQEMREEREQLKREVAKYRGQRDSGSRRTHGSG